MWKYCRGGPARDNHRAAYTIHVLGCPCWGDIPDMTCITTVTPCEYPWSVQCDIRQIMRLGMQHVSLPFATVHGHSWNPLWIHAREKHHRSDLHPWENNRKIPGKPEWHHSYLRRYRESLPSGTEGGDARRVCAEVANQRCAVQQTKAAASTWMWGLHQWSALNTYLFLILIDILLDGLKKEAPEYIMFSDDIALFGDKEVDLTEYLDTLRKSLQDKIR